MEAFAPIVFAVLLAGIGVLYYTVHRLTQRVEQAETVIGLCLMALADMQEGRQASVQVIRQDGGPTTRH